MFDLCRFAKERIFALFILALVTVTKNERDTERERERETEKEKQKKRATEMKTEWSLSGFCRSRLL